MLLKQFEVKTDYICSCYTRIKKGEEHFIRDPYLNGRKIFRVSTKGLPDLDLTSPIFMDEEIELYTIVYKSQRHAARSRLQRSCSCFPKCTTRIGSTESPETEWLAPHHTTSNSGSYKVPEVCLQRCCLHFSNTLPTITKQGWD